MSSEMLEDIATPPQTRSKQERIRDNQRRSRARRQEYLADLEQRLSQCQITCREADIQRAAFLELQIENTRLRELLALAGVNDEFVEHYVSQAVAQSGHFPQELNPALRQLKPKIANMDSARSLSSSTQSMSTQPTKGQKSRSLNLVNPMSASPANMRTSETTTTSTTTTNYNSSTSPFNIQPLPDMSSPASFDWLYQPSPTLPSQNEASDLHCEHFGISAQGPPRMADDNAILCSVAKQMIDQYHISPVEMEQVKAKLAKGLCRPAYLNAGCAINNQTLFQVLNELNARYS